MSLNFQYGHNVDQSKPRHPSLYRLAGSDIELLFSSCDACSALTLGANVYGCRVCGSERLQVIARPGTARLLACIELGAEVIPGLKPPQAIGEIEIAPGVIEEALLIGPASRYAPGMRVVARPIVVDGDVLDCWFEEAAP